MKVDKNLMYLRRHRDVLKIAGIAKKIGITECRMSLLINGKTYASGITPQFTDKQTESLTDVIKELKG